MTSGDFHQEGRVLKCPFFQFRLGGRIESIVQIPGNGRYGFRRAGLLLGGSVFFFVVTNFGNWLMSRVPFEQLGGASYAIVPSAIYPFEIKYANDIWGLLANYGMALGFLGRTLAADLGFSAILVALTLAFSALPHGVPVLVRSKNQS